MPAERFEPLLPEMELLIGQSDMPKARLDRAPKLRAIVNVETNFLQNVDYETCFARGIHVLAPSSAFARPVAEMALGHGDRPLPRRDRGRPGDAGGKREMAARRRRGLLFALWRAGRPRRLRRPRPRLHAAASALRLRDQGLRSMDLRTISWPASASPPPRSTRFSSTSQVIVVFAAVTSENQGFLGKREFELIAPGSVVLLMSRAGVVDFPEFLRQIESGRFRAATDVFPSRTGAARRSGAQGRGPAALAPSGRRDDGLAPRDRPADGRRRRPCPRGPAAALLPARPARDRRALALEADRAQLSARPLDSSSGRD